MVIFKILFFRLDINIKSLRRKHIPLLRLKHDFLKENQNFISLIFVLHQADVH